jgi:hypothetical protein
MPKDVCHIQDNLFLPIANQALDLLMEQIALLAQDDATIQREDRNPIYFGLRYI